MEHRFSGVECRAEGRRLSGPAMRYGEISPSHGERFEPRAFDLDDRTRWLDLRHDPDKVLAWTGGGGLTLTDGTQALEVRADLPEIPAADRALDDVRAGRLNGFSVEFNALAERRENEIRVVERAELVGNGVVAAPSYPGSTAEIRRKLQSGFKSLVPYGKVLECKCQRGACRRVRYEPGAFRDAIEGDREVLAIHGDYSRAVASKSKGTLCLAETDEGLTAEIDLQDSTVGRDLLATSGGVDLIIRPVVDQDLSDFFEIDDVAVYSRVALRALLIGASDVEGWPVAEVIRATARRAGRIWL